MTAAAPPATFRGERAREVVTPEGVPIRFVLAQAGDRLGAFLLDGVFILGAMFALLVPLVWLLVKDVIDGDLVGAVLLLGVFLIRTFYFTFFELTWQGQTPGKRKMGIRAVDARGGPLRAEAIIARNLTREVEVILPLTVIFGGEWVFPGAPGLARLAAITWALLFGFLPLFNRDRRRVGDLVAGTVVVRQPEAILLEDLTRRAPARAAAEAPAFTDAQLDVYGIYELQTLEEVLRQRTPGRPEVLEAVAAKIRAKIGWTEPGPAEPFLEAFYAALRGRLERRLLFGKRRETKHDRS
ncbi:MAG TPA: RDD family protein [Anaeromyxobacteraceae bacterium]|nr:RDD family protein [Anaeromyxobacteraceae bacterium]